MEVIPGKVKVLIAEDDFLIADEIARILKKIGYQLAGTASNGIKAVEMALEKRPDVVIMDIKMPKMDGLEAAKQLIEAGSQAAIIFLTAHESRDLIEEAGKAGIAAYLTKPPKYDDIERALYIALARQRDLIESRNLVRELEAKKRELAKSNSSKDKFFAILAHDLRNPVSALYSFCEHISRNFTSINESDLRQYLNVIRNTSKGLSVLLEDLLMWGNLQNNRYEFKPEKVNVYHIAISVQELVMANAVQKNITVDVEFDNEVIVFADRSMLETVVRNLVGNSVKFTPQDGSVKISVEDKPEEVWISVTDNGVGIYKKDLEKLFQLDQHLSTPGTEGEQGSGLGLVLCKEMIEKNGGKIWAKSEPGKGSKFTFALPKPYF